MTTGLRSRLNESSVAGHARRDPFSFGGAHNDRLDPQQAGIVRWSRHPLLLALALWTPAHLVPNGDLAHVILFGTCAAIALPGGRLIDARAARWGRKGGACVWLSKARVRRHLGSVRDRHCPLCDPSLGASHSLRRQPVSL